MKSKYAKTEAVCEQWGTHPHELHDDHYAEGVIEITLIQYDPPQKVTSHSCYRCADENWGPASQLNFRDADYKRIPWDPRFRWVKRPVEEWYCGACGQRKRKHDCTGEP